MKKNCLFLFLILVNTISNAQNLTRSDIGYQIGGSYTLYQSIYQDPGSNGIGVTWDLSSMNSQFGQYDVTIGNNTSLFAGSNALHSLSGVYNSYFNITDTSIEVIGIESGSSIHDYSNPQTILNFPITSSSDFTDTYASTSNGGTQVETGSIREEFSGYGTLTTPVGTFTDVVRIKQTRIQSITTNAGTHIDTTISYQWYKAGIHHELAVVQTIISTLGNGEQGYYTSADVLNKEENQLFFVEIYPNPTSENIHIKSTGRINDLKIYQLSGELVLEKTVVNSPVIELNTADLNSGIYFIHFFDENGTSCVKRFTKN